MSALIVPGQVRTTLILAASRIRTLRSAAARSGAWVAYLMVCLTLPMAGSAGDLLREAARRQLSEVYTVEQARDLLGWVVHNPQQVMLAAAASLAGTLALTVGAQMPGRLLDVAHGHLVTTGARTRFLETLATSVVSVVPVTQLLALSATASLLTIDRAGRAGALAVAWLLWVLMQVLTTCLLWATDWLRRRRSARRRRLTALVAGVATLVGAAAALTGAAGAAAAAALEVHPLIWAALLAASTVGLFRVGVSVCERAGRLAPVQNSERRQRSVRLGGTPARAVLGVTFVAAWRTRNVRTPLLSVTAMSALSLLALGRSELALPGVAVGIPLAWSLLFTSNFLAVHGTGAGWLGTLPRTGRPLLGSAAVVGVTGSLVPALLALLPALAAGTVEVARLGPYLMLTASTCILLTGAAVLLAVLAPQPRDVAREALLSPGRGLVWTLLLCTLAGAAWLVVDATSALARHGYAWSTAPALGAAGVTAAGLLTFWSAQLVWRRLRTRSMSLAGAR